MNLQAILIEDFGGVQAGLATKMGVSPNNISRYFSDAKDGRKISDDAARKIEKAAERPHGWLDVIHHHTDDPELDRLIQEAREEDPHALKAFLTALALGRHKKTP